VPKQLREKLEILYKFIVCGHGLSATNPFSLRDEELQQTVVSILIAVILRN